MGGISWIKIETTFPRKPVVFVVASSLNIETNTAIGALVSLLCWADGVSDDGSLGFSDPAFVDKVTSCDGLGKALMDAGWIVSDEGGKLRMNNWDMHNGATAKRRAMDARRKEVSRKSTKCPQKNGQVADEMRTDDGQIAELDKIREDKNKRNTSVFPKAPPPPPPEHTSAQRFRITTGKGESVYIEYNKGNDRFLEAYGKQPTTVEPFQYEWAMAINNFDPEVLIESARLYREKLVEADELNYQEPPERWLANRKWDQFLKQATQKVTQKVSDKKFKVRTFSTKGLEI